MERDAAKLVLIEAYRAMHLSDLLPFLQSVCSPEESERLRAGIVLATGAIATDVIGPIYELHPELEQEVAERVERTGRVY